MAPQRSGSFPCEDCDKVFSRKEYADRHRRLTHLGERPYSCEACQRGFARSDLLKRHLTTCVRVKEAKAQQQQNPTPPSAERSPILTRDSPAGATAPVASTSGSQPTYSPPTLPTSDLPPTYAPTYAHSAQSSSSSGTSPQFSPLSVNHPSPPGLSSASSNNSTANSPETLSFSPFAGDGSCNPTQCQPHAPQPIDPAAYLRSGQQGLLDSTTLAPPINPVSPWTGTGWHLGRVQTPPNEFTQNEIEASEVLENLLRSPRMTPPAGVDYGQTANSSYFGVGAGFDGGALTSAGIGGLTPNGGTFWDDPTINLEFTKEAEALADYFNHRANAGGGVGGITALDLGFLYEPSLFPDHLFEERRPSDEYGPDLFIPQDKFCQGFLYPWKEVLPHVGEMEKYAIAATEKLLPTIPVMHRGTMKFRDMSNHSVFALSVAGGAYDVGDKGEEFSGVMLSMKRVYIIKSFNRPENNDDERFQHLQSMILYQLVGFYRDEQHRLTAHTFHGAVIQMFRQLDLVNLIKRTPVPSSFGLAGPELEAAWKEWVRVETWRRVAVITYLLDLEFATHFKVAPMLAFPEFDLELPSAEVLWKANSAVEWQNVQASPIIPPNVHFLAAVRALLAHSPNEPFSDDSLLLNELGRLDALPLLTLTRTLTFLQAKAEEALAQADPFRSMLGGLMQSPQQSNSEEAELLRKIKKGKDFLRSLPGGIQRGSGEGWFEEALPTASVGKPPAESSVLTPEILRAVQADTQQLKEDWPAFMGGANGMQTGFVPDPLAGTA